jgi:hypothetical protein
MTVDEPVSTLAAVGWHREENDMTGHFPLAVATLVAAASAALGLPPSTATDGCATATPARASAHAQRTGVAAQGMASRRRPAIARESC